MSPLPPSPLSKQFSNAMTKPKTDRQDTRELILEKGMEIVLIKGFNNMGLSELLKACNIPKGSFYHFFESKEDFGFQLLERVRCQMLQELETFMSNTALSPLQRLQAAFHFKLERLETSEYRCGCLFGSLAQEMAAQHPEFRERLACVFSNWLARLTRLFDEAKTVGEVPLEFDSSELAELFVNSIEGGFIRCKVVQNSHALHVFEDYFFNKLCNVKPLPKDLLEPLATPASS